MSPIQDESEAESDLSIIKNNSELQQINSELLKLTSQTSKTHIKVNKKVYTLRRQNSKEREQLF